MCKSKRGVVPQDATAKLSNNTIIGRKSDSQQRQAASKRDKKTKGQPAAVGAAAGKFTKSSAVFGMLQDRRNAEQQGDGAQGKAGKVRDGKPSSAWKL